MLKIEVITEILFELIIFTVVISFPAPRCLFALRHFSKLSVDSVGQKYFLKIFSSLSLFVPYMTSLSPLRTAFSLWMACYLCSRAGAREKESMFTVQVTGNYCMNACILRWSCRTRRGDGGRGASHCFSSCWGPGLVLGVTLYYSHHNLYGDTCCFPIFAHEEPESQRCYVDLSKVRIPAQVQLLPKPYILFTVQLLDLGTRMDLRHHLL